MLHNSPAAILITSLTRHYDELVDYLRRRFGDKGFAREIVHDMCVHLMEKPSLPEARQPVAFLKRVSHNMAVNQCRTEAVRNRLMESMAELPEYASEISDPVRELEAQREIALLAQAIERLPLRCKQVFIMHKIHDIPQSEVAQQLGISVKMVERHTRLGIASCKQFLGRE